MNEPNRAPFAMKLSRNKSVYLKKAFYTAPESIRSLKELEYQQFFTKKCSFTSGDHFFELYQKIQREFSWLCRLDRKILQILLFYNLVSKVKTNLQISRTEQFTNPPPQICQFSAGLRLAPSRRRITLRAKRALRVTEKSFLHSS